MVAGPGVREPLSSVLANVRAAFEVDVPNASRKFEALLQFNILTLIAPDLSDLITRFSANVDKLDLMEGLQRLKGLADSNRDAGAIGAQGALVEVARRALPSSPPPEYQRGVSDCQNGGNKTLRRTEPA